jgi:hypothetical protein
VQQRLVAEILRACSRAAAEVGELRGRLLSSLRRAVPFEAAFVATVDPDTLLFTTTFAEEPLLSVGPLFLDNEFAATPDVNRFVDIARSVDPVASLDQTTAGDRRSSDRWRKIMDPLGVGDEARVALSVDGTTWGFMCLHRSGQNGFSPDELAVLAKVAPHAGEALRRVATLSDATLSDATPANTLPQAVILAADDIVTAVGGAIESLGFGPVPVGDRLPLVLAAVVRRLEAIERGTPECPPAAIRVRTGGGQLIAVHATRLHGATGTGPVVLTIAPTTPAEHSSLLLAAYGLTQAQRRVASLVLQGRTTKQIVVELRISANTVLTGPPDKGPPVVGVQPRKWEDDHSHEAPPAQPRAGGPQGP